jgi:hypothetical protein
VGVVISTVIAIRVLVVIAGALSFAFLKRPASPFRGDFPMISWDGIHYLRILTEGYPDGPPLPSTIAFFPLYPLLALPVAQILGGRLALLLVANLASALGALFAFLFLRDRLGARSAFAGVLLLSCFPPAVFLSAAYTEGPFLLAVASAFWLVDRRRPWLAVAVAGLASALRPTGIVLSALILLSIAVSAQAKQMPRRWLVLAAMAVISISGALAYEGYLTTRYGRADAYLVAQRSWEPDRPSVAPAEKGAPQQTSEAQITHPSVKKSWFAVATSAGVWNKLFVLAILLVAAWGLAKPGNLPRLLYLLPIGIFLLGYIPGWGARATSIARFETAAIPCFALLGHYLQRRGAILALVCGACLIGQILYCVGFVNGMWAG